MEKYYWLNKDSRLFLERGYLTEGQTPEKRVRPKEHWEKMDLLISLRIICQEAGIH